MPGEERRLRKAVLYPAEHAACKGDAPSPDGQTVATNNQREYRKGAASGTGAAFDCAAEKREASCGKSKYIPDRVYSEHSGNKYTREGIFLSIALDFIPERVYNKHSNKRREI